MSTLWAVVAGGLITLVGTFVAQFVTLFIDNSTRREARRAAESDFHRSSLQSLSRAATAFRVELVSFNTALNSDEGATPAADLSLRGAQMQFDAVVYGVKPEVTDKYLTWKQVALSWSLGEGSAEEEQRLWAAAIRASGEATRNSFK